MDRSLPSARIQPACRRNGWFSGKHLGVRRLPPAGRSAVALLAVAGLSAAAAGQAASTPAGLRVEADGRQLAAATFLSGTAKIRTDETPSCGGSGEVKTLSGPTALGLLSAAGRVQPVLAPLSASDKFEFGLFLCGVGDFVGTDTAFWLYKVDHVAPDVGGDQFPLKGGEEVLWYFSDTDRNINTGDELVLEAPARARSGEAFEVTVWAYDAKGERTPAAGALVSGETVQPADENGRARVSSARRGNLRLRAKRAGDIPSQSAVVCLDDELERCPARRGELILGTGSADRIKGTAGADVVRARGGADRIRVGGGGRDLVRCGEGRDRVKADRRDRVARDCERVRRP